MRTRLNQTPAPLIALFFVILSTACPVTGYAGAGTAEGNKDDSISVTVQPGRTIDEVYAAYHEELGSRIGSIVSIKFYAQYQICAEGIIIKRGVNAFELHGPIYQKFLALARTKPGPVSEESFLRERMDMIGFPISDTLRYSIRGFYSFFERGTIYYFPREAADSFDPTSGTFVLLGEFYDKWNTLGSGLGPPASDKIRIPRCTPAEARGHDCGFYQHFDRGVIYQRPGFGMVAVLGTMYRYWSKAMLGLDNDPDFRPATLRDSRGALWNVTDAEGNPTLGFPTSDETSAADGSFVQEFTFGSIRRRAVGVPRLRFFAQNTALLPGRFYVGSEKERAISALIDYLRTTPYDVVGLSEAWDIKSGARLPFRILTGSDAPPLKARLYGALRDIYPYYLTGPDEDDAEGDGGLLLLSRYPIVEQHQTIYRQCAGIDCITNKGVLHARVQIPGLPATGYDVFLTHTQNPGEAELSQQFSHLSSFVRAYSSPDRPAILLGDLNANGFTVPSVPGSTTPHDDMRMKLSFPDDVWRTSFGALPGITFDSRSAFGPHHYRSRLDSIGRYSIGQRLDYYLSWPGWRFLPQFANSNVVVVQSSLDDAGRGLDISDHYGINTEISGIQEFTVERRRPITRVSVNLVGFRCLQVTEGFSDTTRRSNDDEPYFELRLRTARGDRPPGNRVGVTEGVNNGTAHPYGDVSVAVGDPGDYLDIIVSGWEHDAVVSDNLLGDQTIRLTRADLQKIVGGSMTRVLPLLTGDGGEYAVTVRITVE
ncbi:MAG: endonuclease/exonuclease/phosphatase family protein [Acidobacteriota bacterium]